MQQVGLQPAYILMTRVQPMSGQKPRQLLRHFIQQFLNSIFPTVAFLAKSFLQGSFHIHELPIRSVEIIFHYYANLNENMVLENNTWNTAGVFFLLLPSSFQASKLICAAPKIINSSLKHHKAVEINYVNFINWTRLARTTFEALRRGFAIDKKGINDIAWKIDSNYSVFWNKIFSIPKWLTDALNWLWTLKCELQVHETFGQLLKRKSDNLCLDQTLRLRS